ncbi:MAG TPA: L-lactate permease [Bryobacteraceae bacterium]|nr:L-lactate permease [Bryobacteraceae bacterium]
MWQQVYTPVVGSLGWSALVAALPVFVLLFLIGVLRKPSWIASLAGLGAAILVAFFVYGMPAGSLFNSVAYGAAFGLFPIGWIVYWAILLYRVTLDTGKFEIIKDSVANLTGDHCLQALLIAFAFGAFIEGAAGFGTPVAVAAAMLTGLGFSPYYAAGICLLANTAPVAFGSIGIPLVTLQGITGLPLSGLSADVGRICAPVSLFVPAYLVLVMGGWKALRSVLPAAAVCGITFAGAQFLISSFVGPYLTDIIGSLAAMGALVILLNIWKPRECFHLPSNSRTKREGDSDPSGVAWPSASTVRVAGTAEATIVRRHSGTEVFYAWAPYGLLVIFVLLWGLGPVKHWLEMVTLKINWPGLHNLVVRTPPVVSKPSPYAAVYTLNWLSASGTSCMFATMVGALVLGMSPKRFVTLLVSTWNQLFLSMVTLAAVLGLAFLMNYCGATATLGLAFAATGVMFPFFSALLGWVGVFLTGSDTSANALFGNLQVVTANTLHLNPVLMASANSSGGVMGKMISLTSIAVASAATEMPVSDEGKLFRFTLRHSILLASVIGVLTMFYAYVMPHWVR